MALVDIAVARVREQAAHAGEKIKSIADVDVAVDSEHGGEAQVQLAVEGKKAAADLVVDVEREVMVATDVHADKGREVKELLKACRHLGSEVACGSLIIPPEAFDAGDAESASDDAWERAGFRKNFVISTATGPKSAGGEDTAAGSELLSRGDVLRYHSGLEKAVGENLEWGFPLAERPYIVSLDVATSLEQGEEAPFHCFLHFHELTKACYIEKIVVPEHRRGSGIGTKVVREIVRLASRAGSRYIYLVAKKDAEGFWAKQGLQPVQRVNYRNLRRREAALKKRPGWDVARVGAEKLHHPVWHYRNHPQDDLDLAHGLKLLNLSSCPKKSRW